MILDGVHMAIKTDAAAIAPSEQGQDASNKQSRNDLDTQADQGDTVTISDEAKQLSMNAGASSDDETSIAEMRVQQLKDRIKELQEQIKEVQESDLPEKEKLQQIQDLTQQLMQMNQELTKLQNGGQTQGYLGGTPAEGFASSLT